MTDGGYTFEEWKRMHGIDSRPSVETDCGQPYDGIGDMPCRPPCSACINKWLDRIEQESSDAG